MFPNGALSYKLTWKIRTPDNQATYDRSQVAHMIHCATAVPVQVEATVLCMCSVIVFINQRCNFMLLFWSMWEVFWSNEYLNTDKMKLPCGKQYNPCLMYGRA